MNLFIIDGNNLIGKIPVLLNLQKKDPQASREQLIYLLDRYFAGRKASVSLHLDGFPNGKLIFNAGKIFYSNSITADEKIKNEIDRSKNPRLITVVSSDHSVFQYAKVNACKVIKSEKFAAGLKVRNDPVASEESIQKTISNEEMKRLFGV